MRRILHMTRKEFIQGFQDPRMIAILFLAPLLQTFLFGYAVTTDVTNIEIGIMDQDASSNSRALIEAVMNSGYFVSTGMLRSDADIERALMRGTADVVLVIPAGFADDLAAGRSAPLQILLDGAESNSANVAVGYLSKIFVAQSSQFVDRRVEQLIIKSGGARRTVPLVEAEMRFRFNPELKSAWYMVPGILGMIMLVITMMMTSMAITREREVGTMEQLMVTPIKPYQLLAGKMLPFALVGLVDVTLILALATGHFGLPLVGSIPLLYLASIVFLFTTLGMGLYISTISHTQQQALFVSFLVLLPAILLSGFMFPIDNMPESVQYLTYLNPLRYFLVIVRGVILKGNGWAVLAPQFGMLFALGAALFGLASLRFNKTVQ
ncbi:MAG: ABC transporter permease [Candidatus Lernaella stagnicola]|nr:ABC transporter permease [Candidatus Lernaella stagnicola]